MSQDFEKAESRSWSRREQITAVLAVRTGVLVRVRAGLTL